MRTVTIGRAPDCDIVLDDEYVSPRHCVLIELDVAGEWIVRDLGSTNGTTVLRGTGPTRESTRLTMGVAGRLRPGDVLVIGRTRMPPFTPERVSA